MFVGQYSHNIDTKGRLAVPAKFRSELKKAVVTKGLDNCLFLYTKKEWDKIAEDIASRSFTKSNNRSLARQMLAGAMEVEIDKQGRVIIPEYQRKFAGLNKKVIVAGLYNRLEIWDEAKWNENIKYTESNANEIAEALEGIGEK
jgi:MraZ protein